MTLDEKVSAINEIKLALHNISPMKTEPVDCVLWVKNTSVIANDYNPNSVAPPEMELLRLSIANDGYTQPIVSMDNNDGTREVIDGFHRNRVGRESRLVNERIKGYLPTVIIRKEQSEKNDRIASTIRHNRARGKHVISAMSDIVIELKRRNWSDERVAKELLMEETGRDINRTNSEMAKAKAAYAEYKKNNPNVPFDEYVETFLLALRKKGQTPKGFGAIGMMFEWTWPTA
jgi:ParB-like chromosome segregation protein Spo0J